MGERVGTTRRVESRRLPGRSRRLALLGLALATAGCERVIDVELPDPQRRLVVEGRVELLKEAPGSSQRIRLTTTDDFFSNAAPPAVTGASVRVTDDRGGVFPYAEIEPGLYATETLLPTIGTRYTLRVEFEGDLYEAGATLRPVAPIDSLYFLFEEKTIFTDSAGYRATIDFADPPGRGDFYLWEQLADGENEIFPDPGNVFNLISEDEFYDGQRVVGYQPNDEIAVRPGEVVTVRQIALSPDAFDYYSALFEQNALGTGDPFSIPPATVLGNVANVTTPGRFAFGFFEAAEVSVAEAIVPPNP